MSPPGRRPGGVDTRGEIIEAARAVFSSAGYTRASLRSIARRAGVDAALVHHYFDDKAALFVAAMELPVDPHEVQREATAGGFSGAAVVERFLAQWEEDPRGASPSFTALVQAMAASPQAAAAMREFLAERIMPHGPAAESDAAWARRRALISSQLLGLAWTRYVMAMEPLASAPRADVARWVGPTVDRYAKGEVT